MDFVYAGSFQSPGTIGKPFTEYEGGNTFSHSATSSFVRARERVCVMNSWKNGASWKSSAAVSLLLAARVHVSEGIHRENEGRV